MTLDDFDALWAEAREEPTFSNGTEGHGWMAANCATCVHDQDEDNGCPLVLVSLLGRRPRQWLDGPRSPEGWISIPEQFICAEYRHKDDPDPNPTPIPGPPGQDGLFPREDYEGVRMLSALPEQTEVTA